MNDKNNNKKLNDNNNKEVNNNKELNNNNNKEVNKNIEEENNKNNKKINDNNNSQQLNHKNINLYLRVRKLLKKRIKKYKIRKNINRKLFKIKKYIKNINSKSFPNINYNLYEDKKRIEKNEKNIFSDEEFNFSEDEEYELEKKSYKNEKYIIWINENEQLTKKFIAFKLNKNFKFFQFKNVNVEQIMNILSEKEIFSNKIFIIISPSLIKKFENEIFSFSNIIYIKIIIFTENEKLNFSKIHNKFLEINSFDRLLKLINEEHYYKVNNIKRKFKGTDEIAFYFEEIKNEKYIYVIAYLLEFMLTPDRSSTDFFNNQIMIKYGKNVKLFKLLRTIINENNITNDLLAKYWLRLYTLESLFYKITNYQLCLNDQTAFYEIYIKILYEALKNSQFNTFFDGNLYRGTKMTNVEINKIKKGLNNQKITVLFGDLKLPFGYVYSKSFFSFSKKKKSLKHL